MATQCCPIRVVVFDFDGTLVDSNEIKRQGFLNLAARHPKGHRAMLAVLVNGGDRLTVLSNFANRMAKYGKILDVDELVALYGLEVDGAVSVAPEILGATPLLAELRQRGLRLHVNSATPHRSLLLVLRARGWSDRFDGIHGGPAIKAETLHRICTDERVEPEEVVVVGDGEDDAASAMAIGCKFVAVGSRPAAISLRTVAELILGGIGN
jgi:phosphoglycolate phosphatase